MFVYVIDFFVGAVLGAFFFAGLWWTVRRLERFEHPVAVTVTSFFLRSFVVLAGFYWMLDHGWQGVGVGLVGFLAIRTVLVRRWGPLSEPTAASAST